MLSRLFRRDHGDPPVGGLFVTRDEEGSFSVLKVLDVDDVAIHVRIYSNQYAKAPTEPPDDLELRGLDPDALEKLQRGEPIDPPGRLGMGHLPFSRQTFAGIGGRLIGVVPVDPSELDGVEEWRRAAGGVW